MSLKVDNITFGYSKELKLLNNLSFSIDIGKTIGIVGVSGTGKSTLLKIIASFLKNDETKYLSGNVSFNDFSIESLSAKGKFSFMFQEPTLMPNLDVYENINLPNRILRKNAIEDVEETIRIVGLEKYRNFYPSTLSGGMKTRVALARCFINDPDLLLLDEPFSSLDIGWKARLYEELELLQKKHNTTVVLVSHDIEEVLNIADRVIVLGCEGKILDSLDIENLSEAFTHIKRIKGIILNNHRLHFL